MSELVPLPNPSSTPPQVREPWRRAEGPCDHSTPSSRRAQMTQGQDAPALSPAAGAARGRPVGGLIGSLIATLFRQAIGTLGAIAGRFTDRAAPTIHEATRSELEEARPPDPAAARHTDRCSQIKVQAPHPNLPEQRRKAALRPPSSRQA